MIISIPVLIFLAVILAGAFTFAGIIISDYYNKESNKELVNSLLELRKENRKLRLSKPTFNKLRSPYEKN